MKKSSTDHPSMMASMIPHVLMIIPELGYGGAARSFSQLSLELSAYCKITIVVLSDDETHRASYELGGVPIYLDIPVGGGGIYKLMRLLRRVRGVRKIKEERDIDISISFLEGADYINVLSSMSDKVILSIRGSKTYDGNIRGWVGWLRKRILIPFLYNRADCIHCVSTGIVHELTEDFGVCDVPKKVIYNFYDMDAIRKKGLQPTPPHLDAILASPYLVIASRLAREKNILPLIKVFAALKRMGLQYRLLIVGDGPELSQIGGVCDSLGLTASILQHSPPEFADVVCIGADNNPYRYINSASAFIMASESEGFPNALAEALVLSVPVISADCPWGPREILHPSSSPEDIYSIYPLKAKYGVLMPQLSDDSIKINMWAEGLFAILSDQSLLDFYRATATQAVALCTKEKIMREWLSVIGLENISKDFPPKDVNQVTA